MIENRQTSDGNSSAETGLVCVYVDSAQALARARDRGLDASIPVRTFSPALAALEPAAMTADAALDSNAIRALEDATLSLSEALRSALWSDDPDMATVAGRVCYAPMHVLILKAACMRMDDFSRPVAVIQTRSGNPDLDETFVSPVPELLAVNPALQVVTVDSAELDLPSDPRPPTPGLCRRLAFAGHQALLYRLAERLFSRSGLRSPRGTVLIMRENELVKETAAALMRRGFSVCRLPMPNAPEIRLAEEQESKLTDVVRSFSADRLAPLMVAPARYAVEKLVLRRLVSDITRYRSALPDWKRRIDEMKRLRPRAVLTNFLGAPEVAALHHVLRERHIPLVTFQHGVTMEIHARQALYAAIHETCCADLAILFNQEGVGVAESSTFAQGPAVAVGLPADYVRGVDLRSRRDSPPIWYIGTALYIGNRGLLFEGAPDHEKAAFETRIVEDVLGRLPHRVLYKPYPGNRFLDETPEIAAARRTANITLMEERIDLRYLIGSARILVVSRSYSTPSWCLMSGRPVVYVDIPDQAPLRDEARAAFAEGTFLYDAGAEDFHESLRTFLSQPIAEIERRYRDKEPARRRLIARFVSAHGACGAGTRAARAIELAVTEKAA